MIVKEAAYDVTEPTVNSQIVPLKASGADTLFHASNARFAAQSIRKAHELGWKVQHVLLSGVSEHFNCTSSCGTCGLDGRGDLYSG